MDLEIKGKTALVTGSTLGIGYAIASQLAQEGVNVVINGRNKERVNDAIASLKKQNLNVTGVAGDLGTAAGVNELTSKLKDVDILVNNMGIFEPKEFFEIPDEDWTRFFEVNVMSGVRLSRHYMPGMLSRNWGRILFISSESALNTPKEMIHYGFTKTAQLAISRGLAELTTGTNVTVNSVLPGPTHSEGVDEFIKQMGFGNLSPEEASKEFVKAIRPSSLIQRLAECEEVANMVAYLCSQRASATNGAAVRVDGGCVRSIV